MNIASQLTDDELIYLINNSSYINKYNIPKAQKKDGRKVLEQLYLTCRSYACESIVDNLRDFTEFEAGKTYHIYCDREHFYILARVRTNWEKKTIEETAESRRYLSFTILTEKNLSHFPGRVLYGYYNGVKPSMIGYIYSEDGNTQAYAKTRLDLAEMPEELYDIKDLCEAARKKETYCQVSIESKTKQYVGPRIITSPLLPAVVISIGKASEDDIIAARQRGLPHIILHPGRKTTTRVHDFFPTPGLSSPRYI